MDQPTPASPSPETTASLAPTDAAATSPTPAIPPRSLNALLTCCAVLVLILTFLLGSFRATNSDVWLHLATGKAIANGEYQFGVDPFSWASEGVYWANSSWSASWLGWILHQLAGPASLVVVKALLLTLMAAFLLTTRPSDGSRLTAIELTALAVVAASHRFLLQPTVFSFLGIALLIWLLRRGGFLGGLGSDEATCSRVRWQIPLLFLVWSNLDAFFVLGLMTLVLVAASLAAFASTRADAKRLVVIFGLAAIACILNPHLTANFTLPNELAPMAHGLLPASWTAAADSIAALGLGDPGFYASVSPFSSLAITHPAYGYNIAGLAFYLLLLINVVSFVTAGFVPGNRPMIGRLAVCLAFGVLAAVQIRMVPFYAIVAGPMSVLNLADYSRWTRTSQQLSGRSSGQSSPLTAWATFATLMLGIVLAWPGWLHLGLSQFQDDALFTSSRRVAWDLQPDPSLLQTALALKPTAEPGIPSRVFHPSFEIAHYCAYFAPEVKGGIDLRLALFGPIAPKYAEVRNGLWDKFELAARGAPPAQPSPEKTLDDWKISSLVITGYNRPSGPKTSSLVYDLLQEPERYLPIVADGQTIAFQISPSESWPRDALEQTWRHEAFAPRPESKWLADDSPQTLPSEPNWLDEYLYGPGATPLETSQALFRLGTFQRVASSWIEPFFFAYQAMNALPAAGHAGAVPGSVLALQSAQSIAMGDLFLRNRHGNEPTWFHSRDLGPAAVPILVHRDLRRSLAKNPNLAVSHALLAQAVKLNLQQESWWNRHQNASLRTQLRQVELVAALRAAVTLAPENIDYRMQLAEVLHTNNHRDAAVAQMREVLAILDAAPVNEASLRKFFPGQYEQIVQYVRAKEAERKWNKADMGNEIDVRATVRDQFERNRDQLRKRFQSLDLELRKRKEDFDLKSAGASDMDRFRLAVRLPWRFTDLDNRSHEDPRGRGLALEALSILERIQPASISDEEKVERNFFLVRLYCLQGRVAEAVDAYNRGKKDFGFANVECTAWIAAATGWYKNLDESISLMEMDAVQAAGRRVPEVAGALAMGLSLTPVTQGPALVRVIQGAIVERQLEFQGDLVDRVDSAIAEFRALRGLFALERGDIARARTLLDQALASDVAFFDRPVAERYRDLIEANTPTR